MKLFGLEFKNNFGKTIAWVIVLGILAGLLIAFFPLLMDENTKSIFDKFTGDLSPAFKAGLGLDEEIDYTNMGQYLAFVYQYVAVLVMMFAMQLGAGSLSREQSSGNIEFIYSNPISRSEIINDKLLANVVLYLLFLVLLAASSFGVSVILQPEDIRKQEILIDLAKIFLGLLGSGLVFMSLGYLLSSMMKSNGGADGISVLFILLIVVGVIVLKIQGLGAVADFAPMEAFKPIHMLTGDLNLVAIGVNVVVIILALMFTYIIYGTKELKY